MGTDKNNRKRTDKKIARYGRVGNIRRKRIEKCEILGLASAAVICMLLICTVSYSSIKVQANTGFKYYTSVNVESGDTLWSIADRYIDYGHYTDKAIYIAEIESINHLDANEILLAGKVLIVPYYSAEYVR